MTSKRSVLLAICETPGWHPPEDSSSIDRSLEELVSEGWAISRLDGYEATPRALDAYPAFTEQEDIADPAVEVLTPTTAPGVRRDRVETLVACMLCELPLSKVIGMVLATRDQIPDQSTIWDNAARLADQLLEG